MDPTYRYPGRVRPVLFLSRPNRFLARVRSPAGGNVRVAHVPNPGRMEELLIPGVTRGWTVAAPAGRRRTHEDLVCVVHDRTAVSIDSQVANRVIAQQLGVRPRTEPGSAPWRREVTWGGVRLDFGHLRANNGHLDELLEVKSSNLKVGAVALFPDAPTARGVRHLRALTRARRGGVRARVLFAVQRDDVDEFRPNRHLDPGFGGALDTAFEAGVVVEAVTLRVEPSRVRLGRRLPVRLDR